MELVRVPREGWGFGSLFLQMAERTTEQNGRTNPFEESAMISTKLNMPTISRAIATARALRGPRCGSRLQAACSTAVRGKIASFRCFNSFDSSDRSPSLTMEQATFVLGMTRSHRSDSSNSSDSSSSFDRSLGCAVAGVPKMPKGRARQERTASPTLKRGRERAEFVAPVCLHDREQRLQRMQATPTVIDAGHALSSGQWERSGDATKDDATKVAGRAALPRARGIRIIAAKATIEA
jgi:hypothetical protein